ncbi:hypothetical protein Pmani_009650 [Petrolisthes manimaculis]|uniref:FAM69 protein-kinase domain-containing protein n=1 Tax=Petrolisthes manimaculis TaxID=1843537 RepID=A0AAE1UHM8_9EUCA|nr:hypothetical protein Pmani_009650 [Petrolisthes manimaculis]
MRNRKKWLLRGCIVIALVTICGWRQKLDKDFLELTTCPACYGKEFCRDILDDELTRSKKITLASFSRWKIMRLLNVKNVYYAERNNVPLVLKKLAHDSELQEFNTNLCEADKQDAGCDITQAIQSLLYKSKNNVAQVVSRFPLLFEMSEGVKCNHRRVLYHLLDKFLKIDNEPNQHHFLTLLAVNMEPLILNAYKNGWFPALIGMCGRAIVEEYIGPTLTQFGEASWLSRADYARQLLEMAQDFTNGEFRLYLTDVSLDNFAVDSHGKVKIIDAENIVMVDPTTDGLDRSEHINEGFGCWDCLSFSYEDLCGHIFADHNYFAVCKGMLSSQSFSRDLPKGLLHSPPDWVMEQHPTFFSLVEDCARPSSHSTTLPRRSDAAAALHTQLLQILQKSGKA